VLAAIIGLLVLLSADPATADKRIALVVGNSAYQNVTQLDNPRNDATLMAETLSGLGFTLIGGHAQLDLDKAALDTDVQNFGRQIQGADVALFYYVGHGVQVNGSNYLVPVGANPTREAGVDFQIVDVNLVLRQMSHHPALPYGKMFAFMRDLIKRPGSGARALEFTILTAARTGETIGARPGEFDLSNRIWIVPGDRMKAGVEHRVPLSSRAIELLDGLEQSGDYVFPSENPKRPLSNMTMLAVLKRMKRTDLTTHGFRSTFRDWAAETTDFPNEIVEMALAHTIGDKSEAAYRRGDMLERRRALMAAWETYCLTPAPEGKLLPLTRSTSQKA
jgi:hypothetical protein